PGERLRVRLSPFGRSMVLMLRRDARFLAKGFSIEARDPASVGGSPQKLCFYSGFVHGQRNSAVTLNMCNGLLGFIRFGEEQLFIEPLAGAAAPASLGLPHLVSRRSGLHVKSSHDPQEVHYLPQQLCKLIKACEKAERGARQEEGPRGRRNAIRPPAREYAVETLVVAARDVVEEHGTEGSTKLLLTGRNIVYNIFQHSSLAIPIHVRLARLVLLHEHPVKYTEPNSSNRNLSVFGRCENRDQAGRYLSWYRLVGQGDDNHYLTSVKIIVSRTDFCVHTDEPCDTVGIAFLGGMCSDLRKCVIAEENGLGLAFTIAHELGHNMGMGHDDDDGGGGGGNSACGLGPSIMAGEWVRGSNSSELSWSPCSRLELQQFLRS
uniref:Peptidase M12B domain-containing protein n=1 Tax=Petromyzon marinus TaxID=7757 RepID=S4RD14_PETMA